MILERIAMMWWIGTMRAIHLLEMRGEFCCGSGT
jgi:hypothetical protein